MTPYTIPTQTKIGHIHLRVSDIEKSLAFYQNLLGFELTTRYGSQAVFLSAGGYHHHIGLNTWNSKNAPPASNSGVGLFHTAILYPTRRDLAIILKRLIDSNCPITGASDHGVSEAIYTNDPDNNGIELYWDKPKNLWQYNQEGIIQMYTEPLDIKNLLAEINS